MADEQFDLFGDPVRLANGRRGRPAHRYSLKTDNKIKVLLALGWSQSRIANACHVSVPTLKKHYFSTLKAREAQRDRLVAWQFEKLIEEAQSGNVGALRELQRMIEKNDQALAAARMLDAPQKPADEPVGKKEEARRMARAVADGDAAGEWGSDLTPGGYAN